MLYRKLFPFQRIYEENEDDKEEESANQQAGEDGDKARAEEKRVAMVERIKKALKCGFDVLDNAFEQLEEEIVESPAEGLSIHSFSVFVHLCAQTCVYVCEALLCLSHSSI